MYNKLKAEEEKNDWMKTEMRDGQIGVRLSQRENAFSFLYVMTLEWEMGHVHTYIILSLLLFGNLNNYIIFFIYFLD